MALLRAAFFVGARRFSSASLLLCAPSALRRLSNVSSTPQLSSDSELLSLLDRAIKWAAGGMKPINVDRAPFYCPFMVQDVSGSQIIILRREYDDEHIEVRVKIPDIINDQEEAELQNGECEEDNEDEHNDEENEDDYEELVDALHSSVAMVVTVSKDSGAHLKFTCTVYQDEIVINYMTARSGDADDNEMYYEGPKFEDLDENLQRGFLTYLEMRGITVAIAHFLFDYMVGKDRREYHQWLIKVKDFMRRDGDLAAQFGLSDKINFKMGKGTGPPAAASALLRRASPFLRRTGPAASSSNVLHRASTFLHRTGPKTGACGRASILCGPATVAYLHGPPTYFITPPPGYIRRGWTDLEGQQQPPRSLAAPLFYGDYSPLSPHLLTTENPEY